MSIKALSEYTFYSRYARYNKDKKRRETWKEAVGRVFDMHRTKYKDKLDDSPELVELINFAQQMQNEKKVLASQRSLQFAGDPIFKHELKMFNCLYTYIDRVEVFREIMYSLLCGCGVGFSVMENHIEKLPSFKQRTNESKKFLIDDSIEGWADSIGVLISSFTRSDEKFSEYWGKCVEFDFSSIRPEGSLIAGQFKAPGYKGLKNTLQKIESLIVNFLSDEEEVSIRPIQAYDIIMHVSDGVLSGGVRRSATICLFSMSDDEMMKAKTGNWFQENPQRSRSNNSVALLKGSVTKERFHEIIQSTKEFGEPGFVWLDSLDIGFNPCVEISLIPHTEDFRSGFAACNLTEINGKSCDSEENFLNACKAAAIIGTLQAGYTNLKYLSKESKEIFEREALLGCSITGMMDNPGILFDPEIQKKGAELIIETNKKVASLIGIRESARSTCVKPAGSTSCVLGTSSGIHPHHAKRYIRRTQANKNEFCLKQFMKENPTAVEESVWSSNKTDMVISFLCEVPSGSIVKNQLSAVELLDKVKLTQENWIKYGTRKELCVNDKARHNVSNTITVKPNEWQDVEDYIFNNQEWFAGISLLPASGDLDYPQAPFATVLTPNEIVKEYGDASVFASGLIVDGLKAFDDNLWRACATVLGIGDDLSNEDLPTLEKIDWVRRATQFADRYFGGDLKRMTYCLKHVSLWKTWCDLKREYKDIDWYKVVEEDETFIEADTMGAAACAGGKCDLVL